jgi:hypothetical protein
LHRCGVAASISELDEEVRCRVTSRGWKIRQDRSQTRFRHGREVRSFLAQLAKASCRHLRDDMVALLGSELNGTEHMFDGCFRRAVEVLLDARHEVKRGVIGAKRERSLEDVVGSEWITIALKELTDGEGALNLGVTRIFVRARPERFDTQVLGERARTWSTGDEHKSENKLDSHHHLHCPTTTC